MSNLHLAKFISIAGLVTIALIYFTYTPKVSPQKSSLGISTEWNASSEQASPTEAEMLKDFARFLQKTDGAQLEEIMIEGSWVEKLSETDIKALKAKPKKRRHCNKRAYRNCSAS